MNILLRLILLCALCCLSVLDGHAQIVSNSAFHNLLPISTFNICTTADVQVNNLDGDCYAWITPNTATPDFFYGCDQIGGPDYGVPYNIRFDGRLDDPSYSSTTSTLEMQAYAGIAMRDNPLVGVPYREYIAQQLAEPLEPGIYKVSFMVRSSNQVGTYLIKQFGCLFTTSNPNTLNNSNIYTTIGDYAPINHPTGFPSNQWYTVTTTINITASTKAYLTIGNFQQDINDADWIPQHPEDSPVETDGGFAYYFIDNVNVCEPCAFDVEITKVNSDDPTKCCYDISFLSENRSCNVFSGFRIRSANSGVTLYEKTTGYGWASEDFSICFPRFESQPVIIEVLDGNGQVVCSKSRELTCNCRCDVFLNQPGLSISLNQTAGAGGTCCWEVRVENNTNIYNDGCDLLVKGIAFTAAFPATVTAASGYGKYTQGSTSYIAKNPAGDIYKVGTSTVIGTICLPQGIIDFPVRFDVLQGFQPGNQPIKCGGGYSSTLECANQCCNEVVSALKVPTSSNDPLKCCFNINVNMAHNFSCIKSVVLQSFNGLSWVTESTMNIAPPVNLFFTIPQCIPLGSSKKIRLVFKNAIGGSGEPVCVKEFTLGCEAECCSAVTELQANRMTLELCCYKVRGYMNNPPLCPLSNYVIQEYSPITNTWNTITSGAPGADHYFESSIFCITGTSATIRIQFRDAGNSILCTRWISLNCAPIPPPGKMGVGNIPDNLQPKVYAVPNPAIDETSIHYTLRETSDVRFSLYNMLGEMMIEIQSSQIPAGDQITTIPTNELPSGMYFMQVQAGSGVVTIPITIVK